MKELHRYPLRFQSEKDATEVVFGMPASEVWVDIEIGNCARCGDPAAEKGQGLIREVRSEDGVLRGDVICIDCCIEDPSIDLDDLES